MGLFDSAEEQAIMLSRTDESHPLASFSGPSFRLDGMEWPTVEHYFQAMKLAKDADREAICRAATPALARKMGRSRFKRVRTDWRQVRRIVMTRAMYTKCKTRPEVAQVLLQTGTAKLIENNSYDYYWGCGRDRRGANTYRGVNGNSHETAIRVSE